MKSKTMRQVVSQLQAEGHSVTYYIRKDGGILIRSIDGTKFFGASGNLVARQMTGVTLSEKKSQQLTRITKSRTTGYENIDKLLRKVQRLWNKSFPHKKGEKPNVGVKTLKKTKEYIRRKGVKETERSLREALKYSQGVAYTENVIDLATQIEKLGVSRKCDALVDVAWDMKFNISRILEVNIAKSYDILYDIDHRILTPEEGAEILRLLHNL